MRYHWIPWVKTSSTHPMTSISGYIDFPPFPVLLKTFESLLLLQFFFNLPQNWHTSSSEQPSQNLSKVFWFSKPFVWYSQSNLAAKTPNRKLVHIFANSWEINTRLGVIIWNPLLRMSNLFCVIWSLGVAARGKNVFIYLMIHLDTCSCVALVIAVANVSLWGNYYTEITRTIVFCI